MTKIIQKTNEPYIWDINGEDYWIINESSSEQEGNKLDLQQNNSGRAVTTRN